MPVTARIRRLRLVRSPITGGGRTGERWNGAVDVSLSRALWDHMRQPWTSELRC